MANIKDFVKQEGQFLKADNVGKEVVAVIIGEAEQHHNEKFNSERLHIPVTIQDVEYTFDCSKTNARVIAQVLGDNTESWKGAEIVLDTYKTKTSEGKMVDVINVSAVNA